jgi:UDP-N-acetylglucosamine--N-acetylmuramyl-(pentapeptide) pyrophosphoryl-undecaprenol N-acetylglucosamine transferase
MDDDGGRVTDRTYLFAGGGTGGHLFPGIAVAERLLEQQPQARILFVGSDRPIERQILAGTPFEHCSLPSPSLADARRHPLRFVRQLLAGRRAARELILRERPAAVIGCGGFASAAPVYVAGRAEVPFVLLEQNVIPGRATRWLSRLGGTVCLSFEAARRHLPRSASVTVTGNPVRQEIAELAGRIPADRAAAVGGTPMLLVLGGSQGARGVNEMLIGVAARAPQALAGWRVVHQTGAADVDRVRQAYADAGIAAEVGAFFDDLVPHYASASLVVSRAGATTLAELACAGVPAILVPYPHAMDNHQWHNAREFEQAGAAVIVEQGDAAESVNVTAGSATFDETLTSLVQDDRRRAAMAAAMANLARPDAAAAVVKRLMVEG